MAQLDRPLKRPSPCQRARTVAGRLLCTLCTFLACLLGAKHAMALKPQKTHEDRLAGPHIPGEGGLQTPEPQPGFDYKLFPLAGYTPKTSFAFGGIGLLHFDMPGEAGQQSSANLIGVYGLNNLFLARLKWELALQDEDWLLRGKTRGGIWSNDFYGMGHFADSHHNAFESTYVKNRFGLRRRLFGVDELYAGLFHELQFRSIDSQPDSLLAAEQPTGFQGGRLAGLGLEFVWDERDSEYAPRDGWYAETSFTGYAGFLGSEYGFWHYELDGRRYFNLGNDHSIGLRGLFEWQGGDVPFWEMTTLGGSKQNRGINKGRFRDTTLLSTQLEYRTPVIWDWLGFSTFASLGTVGDDVGDLFTTGPRWTLGGGPRFYLDADRDVAIRIDVGFSRDNIGVIFSLGEAF